MASSYTLGSLSAGLTFGRWFADGYGTIGRQQYRAVETGLGRRPIRGPDHSAVHGAGIDGGYVAWLGPKWSLTPLASPQYIHSHAVREQVGPMGPGEYETAEAGVIGARTLRLDRWFGHDRRHDLGLHVSHYVTSNPSAALASGARGAIDPAVDGGEQRDGWTGGGANVALRLRARLYLDAAASRTIGVRSGDVTTVSSGFSVLFWSGAPDPSNDAAADWPLTNP